MASTLQALTLYVTHVDTEQTNSLLGISFDAQADQEGYQELEKYFRDLEPLINASSPPPLGALRVNQLCLAYYNNQWNRAEVFSLDEVMMTGYVQVLLIDHGGMQRVPVNFVRTLEMTGIPQLAAIQQCAPFAAKYVLVEVHPPHNNQWSLDNIVSFKRSMEGKQFRAMPVGYFSGALGVRLFTLSGELLSQRFAETGMAIPIAARGPPPVQVQPQAIPPMPMQTQVPLPRNYQAPVPLIAAPSEVTVTRRPNAYMASELEPGKSHEVYVTEIEAGCKLIIQPVENEGALDQLRQQLSTVKLLPLKDPAKGKPCLAVFSEDELLYRAMITSVSASGDTCGLYYVDYGNTETRKLEFIFEIPDSLISLRLLAIRVTLANIDQQLLAVPGFSGTLKSLTQDHLFTCTVVGDQRPQQVELLGEDGSNLRDVLVRNLMATPQHAPPPLVATPPAAGVPQVSPLVKTAQRSPAKPVQELPEAFPLLIKIPRPVTQRTESITITFASKVGEMFGQLESRSLDELEAVQTELAAVYDKLPQKPLIYADVCSHLSDHGVIRWAEDSAFYRVQIVEELANDADVLFVDYGNVLRVPRREIYSPVSVLRQFSRPAFGIRCRLTPVPPMTDNAWVNVVSDASLELTLLKETSGIFEVELTHSPKNQAVRDAVNASSVTPQHAAQNHPITDTWGGATDTTRSPKGGAALFSVPVKKESWSPAASDSNGFTDRRPNRAGPGSQTGFGRDREGLNTSRDGTGYGEKRNWSDSKSREPKSNRKNDWYLHDDREAQANGSGDWGGGGGGRQTGDRSDRDSWKTARQEVARSGWDSTPVVKTPEVKYPDQPSVTGTTRMAEVVFVTKGATLFYCQLAENMTQLDELMAKIATACEQDSSCLNSAKVGQSCLAKFTEDGSWYRGQILSISGQQAEVFFVDYGNNQTTPLSDIKACGEEFSKLPPQAYRCKLTNIRTQGDDSAAALFEEKSMGKPCRAIFGTLEEDSTNLVRLIAEEEDGSRVVLNEFFGAESTLNVPAPSRAYESCRLQSTGEWQTVFVSWYVNPASFYLSSPANLSEFEDWVKDLGDFYGGLQEGELVEDDPVAGRPCVALFEECHQYYRAQVVSVKDGMAKVLYVDYGNVEVVPVGKLKRITPFYLNHPKQALHCGLKGVRYNTAAGAEVSPLESSIFGQGELRALVHPELVDGVHLVELESGGKDVAKQLVDANVVTAGPVNIEEMEPQPQLEMKKGEILSTLAEVSFIKSALEFWVQPEPSAVHELMDRIDQLAATLEFQNLKLEQVKVGTACLALFDEDQRWYRSRIEQVTGEQARVFYVDYGNSTEVDASQLKPLLSDMALFPQCVKCSLDGAQKRTVETESFENLAYGNVFSVVFQSRNPDDGSLVVRLIDAEGNDVNSQLGLPSLTEVYVSHVESPHSFYLQKVADEDAIYGLQEQLTAALEGSVDTVETIDPDQVYAALHPDFGQYFRCRVIGNLEADEIEVRFVDYGDCRSLSKTGLRELTQLADAPPFAVKCSLTKSLAPAGDSWSQQAVDVLKQLAENIVCRAEFAGQDEEGSTIVASLSSDSVDVVNELVSQGLTVTAGSEEGSELKENPDAELTPTEEAAVKVEASYETVEMIPESGSTLAEETTAETEENVQGGAEPVETELQASEGVERNSEVANLDSGSNPAGNGTSAGSLENSDTVEPSLLLDLVQPEEGSQNAEDEISQAGSILNSKTEELQSTDEANVEAPAADYIENPGLDAAVVAPDQLQDGDEIAAGPAENLEEPRTGSALDTEAVSTSSEYEVVQAEDLAGSNEAGNPSEESDFQQVIPSGKISPEDRILPGHVVSGTFDLEPALPDGEKDPSEELD